MVSPDHNDPDPNEQQPIIVVDTSAGTYTRTGVYFAMAHFGKYVQPGSIRISAVISEMYTKNLDVSVSAFVESDTCTCTVVAMNKNSQENQEILLSLNNMYEASLVLTPTSFTTLQFIYCS